MNRIRKRWGIMDYSAALSRALAVPRKVHVIKVSSVVKVNKP